MNEVWKDIDGTDGYYQISNMGNVRSLYVWLGNKYVKRETPKLMESGTTKYGYKTVTLSIKPKAKIVLIQKLVAAAFLSKKPNEKSVLMWNNKDRADNRAENLRWATRMEYGKLDSIEKREAVIKDYQNGMSPNDICGKYNIKYKALYRLLVLNNIPRIRIYDAKLYPNREPKLSKQQKKEIISEYENGAFVREIVEKHDISEQLLSNERTIQKTTIRYVNKYRYIYLDYEWMFKKGLSNSEIQKIVGCSYKLVTKRRRQYENGDYERMKLKQIIKDKKSEAEQKAKDEKKRSKMGKCYI